MSSRRGAFHQFEQLLKKFELNHPSTKQELKHAYLKKVKIWHPDINKNPNSNQRFVELQDDFHQLEKYISNRQFLTEFEQFKNGVRKMSSLDFDESIKPMWQQRHGSPFRHADGTESAGPSDKERNYYYHSTPFSRPESRNLEDDPFEQYRKYCDSQKQDSSSQWIRFNRFPFFLDPQFGFMLTIFIPFILLAHFSRRRLDFETDDHHWIISREIKMQLWEELRQSNLSNRPLSKPKSLLLRSLDDETSSIVFVPAMSVQPDLAAGYPEVADQVSSDLVDESDLVADPAASKPVVSRHNHHKEIQAWDGSEEGLFKYLETKTPVVLPVRNQHITQGNESQKKPVKKRKKLHESTRSQDTYFYTRQDNFNHLHRAVIRRDFDHCLYLLISGYYPGYPDRKHRTALHYAAYSGQTDLCRLLLLFNANPLSLDGFNETPVDAARQAGWKDVERLLIFAASGSYKLALDLAANPDERLRYSQLFASTMASNLSSYIPPDIGYHMGMLRHLSFR